MTTETTRGLALVALGEVALVLMGFSPRAIGRALALAAGRPGTPGELRLAARFWESAALKAWGLSALAATVGLVTLVCSHSVERSPLVRAVAERAIPVAFGIALAAVLCLPALRLRGLLARAASDEVAGLPPAPVAGRLVGAALFAGALLWPILATAGGSHLRATDLLLHWPAWLLVGGGTLAVALYLGEPSLGSSPNVGLATAALVGTAAGMGQAAIGFTTSRIEPVAAGLALALSSCLAALVGQAVVALPLQDRAACAGFAPGRLAAGRRAALLLPVLAFLVVLLSATLAMIPMERTVEPAARPQQGAGEGP